MNSSYRLSKIVQVLILTISTTFAYADNESNNVSTTELDAKGSTSQASRTSQPTKSLNPSMQTDQVSNQKNGLDENTTHSNFLDYFKLLGSILALLNLIGLIYVIQKLTKQDECIKQHTKKLSTKDKEIDNIRKRTEDTVLKLKKFDQYDSYQQDLENIKTSLSKLDERVSALTQDKKTISDKLNEFITKVNQRKADDKTLVSSHDKSLTSSVNNAVGKDSNANIQSSIPHKFYKFKPTTNNFFDLSNANEDEDSPENFYEVTVFSDGSSTFEIMHNPAIFGRIIRNPKMVYSMCEFENNPDEHSKRVVSVSPGKLSSRDNQLYVAIKTKVRFE